VDATLPPRRCEAALMAVAVLDEFVAEIVRQARSHGLRVPAGFFDWTTADATALVERLVRLRTSPEPVPVAQCTDMKTALRCAVRFWVAPWVVVRFPALQPLFPELAVATQGGEITVLVRAGRWRCAGCCKWKLCEIGGAAVRQDQ
jgi:hypothetical protein